LEQGDGMRISTVPLGSPDDAFGIVCSCRDFDQPGLPPLAKDPFLAALADAPPGQVVERYVGLIDDAAAGYLVLRLPSHDKLTPVELDLRVVPRQRRRGVGRALLHVAAERARAHGRQHLVGTSVETRPDGSAFAEAMGARVVLQLIRSRLDLHEADQERLDALLAEAWRHASGYRLVQWVGTPPDDIIDDVAELAGRFYAEAPTGDLQRGPQPVDASMVRAIEASNARGRRQTFHSAVLRDGRVAGLTTVAALIDEPIRATQHLTLVRPEDRGHRLGLLLKLENLRLIRSRRPDLRFVDTLNALDDDRIRAINRTIGFLPAESTIEWQLTVRDAA
jgi:GNAT superfamily N-acetyltransferase